MARPKIDFEIKIPTAKSPAAGRSDRPCGADWDIPVEIRAPYKNVDKFVNMLPMVYSLYEALSDDLETSLPIMVTSDFRSAVIDAIDGAAEMLDEYNDAGFMDGKNRSAIQKMIDRARSYVDHASKLKNYWKSEYSSHPGKAPPGWPLEQELAGNGCEYKAAPEKGGIFTFTQDGPGEVNFTCPTTTDKDNHEADRTTFFKLMEAAVRNARCAQEAAAAVGTYYRNKDSYDSQPGGGAVKYAPKKAELPKMGVAKMPAIPPPGAGEPEEEPPVIEEEPEEEPPPPPPAKKKKKDNTLLIAGAAALGLLMLKK